MTIWGIVVAAGRGERFGGEKHEALIGGIPLWRRARDVLIAGGVEQVVVVGPVEGGIPGGPRRRDSVAAGLQQVEADADVVLVHDAARPLASVELVRRVITRLAEGDVDGVVPALDVTDTLKRVDGERVAGTVVRDGLVAVQTPQGFRVESLRRAHRHDDDDATDDAALVERSGGAVVTVPGEPHNMKVTYPDDLAIVEALLR